MLMMKDGTMSVTKAEEFNPIWEASPNEAQDGSSSFENMQTELHSKGAVLTKAWSDLFSFITKYQAELVVKENSVEIAEKEIEDRKKQLEEVASAGAFNDETLQDMIRTKERLLNKAQSELGVKNRMLQSLQSDLSSHMELLEKSQSDLVRYRGDVEQLKSELNVKREQIKIKDNLLKKLQNQLMKENAELKEQLELEQRARELEKQMHELTKRTMSSSGPSTRKRALSSFQRRSSTRTSAGTAATVEIPDSPPTLDLSDDQNFGLSDVIPISKSQTQSSEQGRRVSSRLRSATSASQSSTDHSSRLRHTPTASASSQVTLTLPKDAQFPATFLASSNNNVPVSDATAITDSDTYFPLSVSEDTKPIDILSMKVDTVIEGDLPPESPSSGTSDNEDAMMASELIHSPEGSTDAKSTREEKDELLTTALSSIGATITIDGAEVSTGQAGTRVNYDTTESGTVSVVDGAFSDASSISALHSAGVSTSNVKSKITRKKRKPDPKKFKCEYCEMAFSTSKGIILHTRTHTGDRPFKCSTCLRAFSREDTLRSHVRIHTGERPMKCPICEKSFRDKKALRCHLLSHKELIPAINIIIEEQSHEIELARPIYKCKVCQKECWGMKKYKTHLMWHKELAPALHSIIEQLDTDRIQALVPKEPIQCPVCCKSFQKNSYLKVHLRSHTGEKPCLCSICGKSYHTDSGLFKHMATHSGIELSRTQLCRYCGKVFRNFTGWQEHERTHTGEMPYTCDLCGKSFRSKSNLNAHVLRMHRK